MSGSEGAQGNASAEPNPRDVRPQPPYSPPRLTRYGDLAKLTEGGHNSSHDTGSGNPGTKT